MGPSTPSTARRFLALDGWRGVCALLVAMFHMTLFSHIYMQPLVRNAWLFVDFFFVLSGFVVTHAYAARLNSGRQFIGFVIRRFGRLWPLHVFTLAILIGLELTKLYLTKHGFTPHHRPFTGRMAADAIPAHLLLAQALGFFPKLTWNVPSWSISTEFYTYLLFGAFCLYFAAGKKLEPRARIAALCIAAMGAVVIYAFSPEYMSATEHFGIFRCIYGFFIGHVVYRFAPMRASKRDSTISELLVVIAVVAYVSSVGASAWSMAAPLVFGLTIWIFASEAGYISRIMISRPAQKLGDWSYSIYMIHMIVFIIVSHDVLHLLQRTLRLAPIGNWAQLPSTGEGFHAVLILKNIWLADSISVGLLALVLATAYVTYTFIEVPSRRYFGRIAQQYVKQAPNRSGLREAS